MQFSSFRRRSGFVVSYPAIHNGAVSKPPSRMITCSLLLLALAGCDQGTVAPDLTSEAAFGKANSSLTITPSSATIAVGETVQLSASTSSVQWSSSAAAVATVAPSGLVTGLAAGTATITAKHRNTTAQAVVTVTAPATSPPIESPVQPTGPAGNWRLIFQDEFSGADLDVGRWNTSHLWGSAIINNELQNYSAENVIVSNGTLQLKAERRSSGGQPYTSGMIASWGKFAMTYGVVEARIRVPAGQGFWPAFWMMPAKGDSPFELDIMENLGHDPRTVYMVAHWKENDTPKKTQNSFTGPDFSADWHTVTLEWNSSKVTWYVDGVVRHEHTNTSGIPNEPMYLIANLAVGGSWPGSPDASTPFPSTYAIDYIRAWQK